MWSQSWRRSTSWAQMLVAAERGCGWPSTTACWSATLRRCFGKTQSCGPTISPVPCSWTQRSGKFFSATSKVLHHWPSACRTSPLSSMNGPRRHWLSLASAPFPRQTCSTFPSMAETFPIPSPCLKNHGIQCLSHQAHWTHWICRENALCCCWREGQVCYKTGGLHLTHQIWAWTPQAPLSSPPAWALTASCRGRTPAAQQENSGLHVTRTCRSMSASAPRGHRKSKCFFLALLLDLLGHNSR